jgi:hypothetical protein
MLFEACSNETAQPSCQYGWSIREIAGAHTDCWGQISDLWSQHCAYWQVRLKSAYFVSTQHTLLAL